MRALVFDGPGRLHLEDRAEPTPGADEAVVAIRASGICGSDVHYHTHGRIGPFVVSEPTALGHEGAGTVVEVGEGVTTLKPGDRVCIEPGVPSWSSRAAHMGL